MIKDIFKYAFSNLLHRRLRSFLSVLSILIGVTAIFALLSFGQGINKYMADFAQEMGTDKIMMLPGSGLSAPPGTSNTKFTDEDIDFVDKISGVDEITGLLAETAKVKYKDYKEKYTYIFGFSTESSQKRLMEEMMGGIEIIDGRSIKKGDLLKVVVGYSYTIEERLFKKAISAGDKIEINNIEVEVVGIYEEIGSPQDDAQIYISKEGFKKIFDEEGYEYVYMRVAKDQQPSEVAEKIEEKFRKHRNLKEGQEDFVVQTFEDLIKTFTTVIAILNGVLVLIALISVVVAAVNIMNTMYTSVLERTQEIGVMKSIGAKNKYILMIFIVESGLLGLVGGIIGVIFGYAIAKLGASIAASAGLSMLRPAFPLWLTLGCLIFAFIIGMISGLVPSIQASKLKPVDALRYE